MSLANLKVVTRLSLGFGAVLVMLVAIALLGIRGMESTDASLEEIIDDNVHKMQLVQDMSESVHIVARVSRTLVLITEDSEIEQEYQKIVAARSKYNSALEDLEKTEASSAGKIIRAKIKEAQITARVLNDKVINLAKNHNDAEAVQVLLKEAAPATTKWQEALDEYIELQKASNEEHATAARTSYNNTHRLMIVLAAMTIIFGLGIAWAIARSVTKPINAAVQLAQAVAKGDLSTRIDIKSTDELGQLLQALGIMQTNLGNNLEIADKKAQEMLRIKTALDASSINIRVADKDGKLIYLNNALIKTLKRTQEELRKKISDFDPDNMVGRSVGIFYDDPQAAVTALKNLRAERQGDIEIGGRNYWLISNPIFNAAGEQDGTVGQWIDKTDELRTEQEVSDLVLAAAAGDLSRRIDLSDKTGFFLSLSQNMNQMLATTDGVINETVGALERIANGDMTQQIETEYTGAYGLIKDNANLTIQRLTDIVSEIKAVAHATNTSATEIAAGNIDLSQRTEEQASSLEETASSMEQMASTVKQNADNARQANMLATEASQVAVKGGKVVSEVVITMSEINSSSKKIVDIISVIDGIAFQTNILALNAAVEAARAGEQGRGFAVVATEVRNLAQRSAAAAKEIKQLIGDSVDKVAGGTKLVEDAGKTMDEIVTAVKLVTDIVNEIAAASQEQSAGIDQVNNAITNMDEVTQQNAALVEEAAAAASSMEQQTQDLIDSVAVFQLPEVEVEVAQPALRRLSKLQPKTIAAPEAIKPKRVSRKSNTSAKDEDWEEF